MENTKNERVSHTYSRHISTLVSMITSRIKSIDMNANFKVNNIENKDILSKMSGCCLSQSGFGSNSIENFEPTL